MKKNVWVVVTSAIMIAGEIATKDTPALVRDDEAASWERRGKVRLATADEAAEFAEAAALAELEAAEAAREEAKAPRKSRKRQQQADADADANEDEADADADADSEEPTE